MIYTLDHWEISQYKSQGRAPWLESESEHTSKKKVLPMEEKGVTNGSYLGSVWLAACFLWCKVYIKYLILSSPGTTSHILFIWYEGASPARDQKMLGTPLFSDLRYHTPPQPPILAEKGSTKVVEWYSFFVNNRL